jgi:hypothetical protein
MIKIVVEDLLALAQRCTGFARQCSEASLSRALQELAIDLTEKASEFERNFDK